MVSMHASGIQASNYQLSNAPFPPLQASRLLPDAASDSSQDTGSTSELHIRDCIPIQIAWG